MTLHQFVITEVGPPWSFVIGTFMMTSGALIVGKVVVASKPQLGWKRTSMKSRVFDTAFAMFFIIRALMIFDGGTINQLVIFLAAAGMVREVNGFLEYRAESARTCKINVTLEGVFGSQSPAYRLHAKA